MFGKIRIILSFSIFLKTNFEAKGYHEFFYCSLTKLANLCLVYSLMYSDVSEYST